MKDLLIRAADEGRAEWLTRAYLEKADFEIETPPDMTLPVSHVSDIYSTRYRISRSQGVEILGFEWLLQSLAENNNGVVAIIKMRDKDGIHYLLFLDPEQQYLYGVLRFPIGRADGSEPHKKNDMSTSN